MTGYLKPATLEEALAHLAAGRASRLLAGGTDLYPAAAASAAWLGAGPGPLLDLSAVPDLAGIADAGGHTRIGARVTWAALRDAALPPWLDGLRAAAGQVGGAQVQNRGTLVGNLCNASPAADGVPPLLALDAAVEIAGPAGRRVLALPEFLQGNRRTALRPGEIATAILVPHAPAGSHGRFLKLGARAHLVISIVMVAGVIEAAGGRIRRARLAVGACSEVAQRLPALEAALAGRPLAEAAACVRPDHLAALTPIDDVRATAAYRRHAALVLLRRMLGA